MALAGQELASATVLYAVLYASAIVRLPLTAAPVPPRAKISRFWSTCSSPTYKPPLLVAHAIVLVKASSAGVNHFAALSASSIQLTSSLVAT